jgi:hypothetical protein
MSCERSICHALVIGAILASSAVQSSPFAAFLLEAGAEPASSRSDTTQTTEAVELTFRVVTTRRKPVAGASVQPWAIGYGSGSSLISKAAAPPVTTDVHGEARIRLRLNGSTPEAELLRHAVKAGLRAVALRVDHPDHPVWSEYVELAGNRPIMLSDSITIQARAHLEHETLPLQRLFPVLSGSLTSGANWNEQGGLLTIRRVDIDSEQPSRLLRVLQVPVDGPARFSELLDLKLHSENPISFDLTMKPGVRVEGRLASSVPRPVREGHVVATAVHGEAGSNNWVWWATTEITPDGRFVLDSLPPDENLQLVALCDGWVSASPTLGENAAYAARYGFKDRNYTKLPPRFVCPRLVRLEGSVVETIVPMVRTARCEVTVTDEHGGPLANASVTFWPTQMFYNHVSNLVGTGIDGLANIRDQLASGKHRTTPWQRLSRHYRTYTAKTDARGVARVSEIPLGGPAEPAKPTAATFDVTREGYFPIGGPTNNAYGTVKLLAAQTGHITVTLKKK